MSSPVLRLRGSQVTPPFAPPKGTPTRARATTNRQYVSIAQDAGSRVLRIGDDGEGLFQAPVIVTNVDVHDRLAAGGSVWSELIAVIEVDDLETLARLKLACHPVKTRVVGLSDGSAGFDFLGFHFRRTPMVRSLARWAPRPGPVNGRRRPSGPRSRR